MKTVLPCKITYSRDDDCWYVEAPGFYRGIMTCGDTLAHAKAMAAEAAGGLLESHLEHGDEFHIPPLPQEPGWYAIAVETDDSVTLHAGAGDTARRHEKAYTYDYA